MCMCGGRGKEGSSQYGRMVFIQQRRGRRVGWVNKEHVFFYLLFVFPFWLFTSLSLPPSLLPSPLPFLPSHQSAQQVPTRLGRATQSSVSRVQDRVRLTNLAPPFVPVTVTSSGTQRGQETPAPVCTMSCAWSVHISVYMTVHLFHLVFYVPVSYLFVWFRVL